MSDGQTAAAGSAEKAARGDKPPADNKTAEARAAEANVAIEKWLTDNLRGGPIARDVNCWNSLQAALPSLRDIILKGE